MDRLPPATSLLEELDRRQDDVLMQLEQLEERLTTVLAEYGGIRPAGGRKSPSIEGLREAA